MSALKTMPPDANPPDRFLKVTFPGRGEKGIAIAQDQINSLLEFCSQTAHGIRLRHHTLPKHKVLRMNL